MDQFDLCSLRDRLIIYVQFDFYTAFDTHIFYTHHALYQKALVKSINEVHNIFTNQIKVKFCEVSQMYDKLVILSPFIFPQKKGGRYFLKVFPVLLSFFLKMLSTNMGICGFTDYDRMYIQDLVSE